MDFFYHAVLKLHRYLVANHWSRQALIGPDSGIRFNYRIGRFIKSYLRALPWKDDHYYLQAQGYWTLGNWRLFARTGDEAYRQIALSCSTSMLTQQQDDGSWVYPNPEWKGRIATVEGTWGSLGLLETYRQTVDPTFLSGALRWHQFLLDVVGLQQVGDELSANYFANRDDPRVPNISGFVLRFLAELADLTREKSYLHPCTGLLTFMQRAQQSTGELPYEVGGPVNARQRLHFQCYQYNAFECLDLLRYYEITGDTAALPVIAKVLSFLCEGLAKDGHAFYDCGRRHRRVTYHSAALAAAFVKASHLHIGSYDDQARQAYSYLLRSQRPDGSFPHSRGDHYLLSDQRSYPRNLAMILYHLLEEGVIPLSEQVKPPRFEAEID